MQHNVARLQYPVCAVYIINTLTPLSFTTPCMLAFSLPYLPLKRHLLCTGS